MEHTTLAERQAIVRNLRATLGDTNTRPSQEAFQNAAEYFRRRRTTIILVWSKRYDLALSRPGPHPAHLLPQLAHDLAELPPGVQRAPLRTVAGYMNLSYGALERRLQELDTAVAELSLEVWFSSDDRALERLVNYIESATATFDISMYALTHPVIGAAILRRYHSGVRVRIATDFDMARDNPELILEFIASGIPVYVRRTRVMIHEKFAVLDGRLILCGSANWSLAAFQGRAGNYENIYAFRNVFAARIHTVHFEMLVSEGNYLVEDSLL